MAKEDQDDPSPDERKTPGRFSGPGLIVPLLILALIAGYLFILSSGPKRSKIEYSFFLDQLREKNVAEVELLSRYGLGKFKKPPELPAVAAAAAAGDSGKNPPPDDPRVKTVDKPPAKPRVAEPYFIVSLPERANENTLLMKLLDESEA